MRMASKRVLSLLLSLMMWISLVSGLSLLPVQAATVNYVYSGSYVYNWGVRETVATFLSPMAEDFYTDNNITYEDLSALSGASSTGDVPYSALYEALHELMYTNLTNATSYAGTRELYRYTDCQNSAKTSSSISSFYSGAAIGPAWDSGSTWNREHVWPNSRSNSGSSYTDREEDIMMLRPTSVKENSSRSNTPYGEGSSYYDPNEESGGAYNVRGDVSRVILYVYTCWGGSDQHDGAYDYLWGSSGVIQSKDILLKWMEEDPVDTWELGRNDAVQAITGTRNVFVDYPELAFELFNEDVPTDYETPSGGAAVSYTISASTNNSTYGTVSVSGKTITATPKTGYAVSGYTILSGTATVTREGNTFKVVPTSDVSICINFAKREQATVQFSQLSTVVGDQTAYVGDSITLPSHSGATPDGYTFVGWSEQTVEETTVKPAIYTAGSAYTVGAGTVLYAVYSRFEGSGNSNVFAPYSGALTEGDYVIVYNKDAYATQAMIAENTGSSRLNFTDITYVNGSVDTPDEMAVWHIAQDGSYWTLYNESTGTYAGGTGTKNQAKPLSEVTDFALWSVSGTSTYEFVNKGNAAKSINANLRRNGTYGFACYSTSTGGALTLYKRASGTVYYFTGSACDHDYAAATCTDPKTCILCGVKVGAALGHTYDHDCDTTCNRCGDVRVTEHTYENACDAICNICGVTRVPADHVYDNACDADCNVCGATRTPSDHIYVDRVTTAATCGAAGVRTYTCSVCGDSYTTSIAATGLHTYANACDADCNVCGTLRTPADHVYNNACDADCNVCGAIRTPAAHEYTADCDTVCDVCGAERTVGVGGTATITFDEVDKRTDYSTTQQIWKENGIVVTNLKDKSTSNVADYYKPARFYQNSTLEIAYPGMVQIVFNCNTAAYATSLQKSIGAGAAVDGKTVTVSLDSEDSFTCVLSDGQVRVDSIVVTGQGAEHIYDNACDADCNACGMVRQTGDHVYDSADDVDCNVCGAVRVVAYDLFVYGGCSVSEDVNGVAFLYTVAARGMVLNRYIGDYTAATITPNSDITDATLVMMGAVLSHNPAAELSLDNLQADHSVIDIQALYFFAAEADSATYAVRARDIPDNHKDTSIYARPYYIYVDADGNETVCYGETQSASYNSLI